MRIVYMGTPDFAVAPLRAIAEAGYEVAGVVTQPDKPKGRGKALMPTPVKEEALKFNIPVFQPAMVRAPEFQEVWLYQYTRISFAEIPRSGAYSACGDRWGKRVGCHDHENGRGH